MNLKRTVVIGVTCGALAVWIAAAATSDSRPIAVPPLDAGARVVEVSGAALASEIARLHERLRPTAVPLQSRDLFRYAPARATTVPSAVERPPVRALESAVVSPPLRLVGVAEDPSDAGVVRTAIVSGYGELFLVKEGESVTLRYRVSRVLADEVELIDATDQTTLRLAIR